jgi:hypothetical protein
MRRDRQADSLSLRWSLRVRKPASPRLEARADLESLVVILRELFLFIFLLLDLLKAFMLTS